MAFLDISFHHFPDICTKIEIADRPIVGTTTEVIQPDKNLLYIKMSH